MIKNKNIKTLTDEQLVNLFKKKNSQKYIGELYNRYAHLVYGVCLKYLKNVEDAQDTLMHVFEKLMQNLNKYEVEKFKPWLYQMAKNECLMKLRKTNKINHVEIENNPLESDHEESLQEKKEQEREYTELEQAIEQLNTKQKECVKLFYLEKKSYQEIELVTGYSLKEVKSAIQNGKRNLKIILEQNQAY